MSSQTGQIIIPNVKNGVKYQVRLRGKNRVKHSEWSNVIEITPRGKPLKPSVNVTGGDTSNGDGTATIAVSLTSNGGNDITNYKYSLNGAPEYQFVYTEGSTVPLQNNTFTVNSLTEGNYTIRVIAVNSAGDSPPSDSVSFITGSRPTQPTLSVVTDVGSVSVTVNSTSTSPITNYNYEYSIVSNFTSGVVTASTTNNTFTITGLSNSTTYYIRASAVNSVGASLISNPLSFITPGLPVAPTISTVSVGVGSITVAFTQGTNSSPITGYKYRYSTSNLFQNPIIRSLSSSATSFTITGLSNNLRYYIGLNAVNAVGDSSEVTTNTILIPPEQPPTNVNITALNASVRVNFTAPSAPAGLPIKGYKYSLNNGVSITRNSTENPFTITSLTNGTSYTLKLRAFNDAGDSTWSSLSNQVMPLAPPTYTFTSVTWSVFNWAFTIRGVEYLIGSATVTLQLGGTNKAVLQTESGSSRNYIYMRFTKGNNDWLREQYKKNTLSTTLTISFSNAVGMGNQIFSISKTNTNFIVEGTP